VATGENMKYNEKPFVFNKSEEDKKYLIKHKNSQETYYSLAFWSDTDSCFYDYDRDGEKYVVAINEDDEWFEADIITKEDNPYSLKNVLKLISFSATVVLHDKDGNRICALEMLNENSKLFENIMRVLRDATVTEIDRGKNDYEIILKLDV
jgi:hypothetical protein